MGRTFNRLNPKAFLMKKLSDNHSFKKFIWLIIMLAIALCFGKVAWGNEIISLANKKLNDKPKLKRSAPTNYFRSKQTGDWLSPSTWESSADNVTWISATEVPTQNASTIILQSGHTVSVKNSVSLDETIVEGILELQSGGILNINDGVGDDISISQNGVLKVMSTGSYSTSVKQATTAIINIASSGKITIGDGNSTVGTGYEGFATSPINKWNDGAIFEYNNDGVFKLSNLKFFQNAAENEIPIFRISKTNGQFTVGSDFHLNGLLELNTDVTFSGSAASYFKNGITGSSTLTQKGKGKFYLTANGAILGGSSLKIVLESIMNLSSTTIIPTTANVTISGNKINNSAGSFIIDGTLDFTNNEVYSNNTIIINGTFKTSHPAGFSGGGASIPSGSITLNPGSTIELYADGDQKLTARNDFDNLIFSGSGIKTPSKAFVPGSVTIKDDAIFDCTGSAVGGENTDLTMTGNSRLIVSTTGENPGMGGVYNLTGGVVEFKGSNLTSQTIRNETYQNIEVTGTNVANSGGHIILNANGTFTVKNGGSFTINDNSIKAADNTNGQIVTVENKATFRSGNKMGFHGFVPSDLYNFSSIHGNISNIILEKGSTVEYCRANPPLTDGDQVITNANGLVYQNLILSGSGNTTAPPGDLVIHGNFSKTSGANYIHNNGTVIFNGDDEQTYSCISPQIVFNNLTNKNSAGLNINDSLSVYKRLLLDDNSGINLNADVTLQSNKNQTAYLSRLGTNAKINYGNGRFIVERYINTNTVNGGHDKSWQLLSTPAFGETVFDTWQEKGNKNISGYGTFITNFSNADNSFDGISASPSMKYYDAEKNTWIGIASTKINLENEKGYMLFVRGDRMATTINSPATPTILRSRGKLYELEFLAPQSTVPPGKFQCIGNPYASAIDFTKINFSNKQTSYVAWDPSMEGNYGLGGYQTISSTIFYHAIPGNTANYNTVSEYKNIQSGQAFFVYNSASSPTSVSFAADCKLDDANHLVNRQEASERKILFANLFTSNGLIADGNAVAFDKIFSNKIDHDDALKINKGGENFGIKNGQKELVVEARENITSADTVFYQLTNLSKQNYQLKFNPQQFGDNLEAYLVDKFLNSETPISLNDSSVVTFMVTAEAASARADRFFVVFKRMPEKAEVIFSINAYPKDLNVILEWEIQNDPNVKEYHIEHGKTENNLTLIKVNPADNNLNQYFFVHNQPFSGNNFYRIKKVGLDGKIEFSKIVKVSMPEFIAGINVFSKPSTDGDIYLQFINQPGGKYQMNLFNSIGQLILSKNINYEGGSRVLRIPGEKMSSKGIYYLQLIKPNRQKTLLKVMK